MYSSRWMGVALFAVTCAAAGSCESTEEGSGPETSCCLLGVLDVCRCAPPNGYRAAVEGGNDSVCAATIQTGLTDEGYDDPADFCHYTEASDCFEEMRSQCTKRPHGSSNCCKLAVLETCDCAPWFADEAVAGGDEITCQAVLEANISWEDGTSPLALCHYTEAINCYEENSTACE